MGAEIISAVAGAAGGYLYGTHESESEINELEQTLANTKVRLGQINNSLEALRAQLAGGTSSGSAGEQPGTLDGWEGTDNPPSDEYDSSIDSLVASLQQSIADLNAQLEGKDATITDLSTNRRTEAEYQELYQHYLTAVNTANTNARNLEAAQAERDAASSALTSANATIAALQEQLANSVDKATYESVVAQLNAASAADTATLQTQVATLTERVNSLTTQLASANSSAAAAQNSIALLREQAMRGSTTEHVSRVMQVAARVGGYDKPLLANGNAVSGYYYQDTLVTCVELPYTSPALYHMVAVGKKQYATAMTYNQEFTSPHGLMVFAIPLGQNATLPHVASVLLRGEITLRSQNGSWQTMGLGEALAHIRCCDVATTTAHGIAYNKVVMSNKMYDKTAIFTHREENGVYVRRVATDAIELLIMQQAGKAATGKNRNYALTWAIGVAGGYISSYVITGAGIRREHYSAGLIAKGYVDYSYQDASGKLTRMQSNPWRAGFANSDSKFGQAPSARIAPSSDRQVSTAVELDVEVPRSWVLDFLP